MAGRVSVRWAGLPENPRVGGSSNVLHNMATMWRKEHQRCSQASQLEMADTALKHPSLWTLLGSPDTAILEIAEEVYRGEWTVAPSVLPCKQQDESMRIMSQELPKCMTRAGLQSETGPARPSSRNWRHSHGHSTSQTQSPSAAPWGRVGQETKGRYLSSMIQFKKEMNPSRRKSRSRWHQSPWT